MDIKDFALLFVVAIVGALLTFGLSFGAYKYGRHVERRDLTQALQESIEATYYAGRGDAEADCRQGWIK